MAEFPPSKAFAGLLSPLAKVRSRVQSSSWAFSVVALFEKFCEYKSKSISEKTIEKYRATLGYLRRFFEDDSGIGYRHR